MVAPCPKCKNEVDHSPLPYREGHQMWTVGFGCNECGHAWLSETASDVLGLEFIVARIRASPEVEARVLRGEGLR